MRGVIKGVLAEELKNSLRMQKRYVQELKKLPKGSLSAKEIKGHVYMYVVQRIGPKVKYVYKGKMSPEDIKLYKNAKIARAKYRNLLSQVKKQIRFLKGSLRGKEAV